MIVDQAKYTAALKLSSMNKLKALKERALGESPLTVRLLWIEALAHHLRAVALHEPDVEGGRILFNTAFENEFGEALGLLREAFGASDDDVVRVLDRLKPSGWSRPSTSVAKKRPKKSR